MIGATPVEIPFTIPDEAPIVATAVFPLVHTPPEMLSVSVIVPLVQRPDGPEIVPLLMVDPIFTIFVAEAEAHAVVTVYIMVSVEEVVIEVRTPPADIVALPFEYGHTVLPCWPQKQLDV